MNKYLQAGLLVLSPLLLVGCALVPDRTYPSFERPLITPRPPTPTPEPPEPPQKLAPPAPLPKQSSVVPSPKLPNPNGYDLLVRAATSIQPKLAPANDLPLQREAVKQNAAAMAMVRQALKLPIVAPPQRDFFGTSLYHSKLRMLARAIIQQAQVQAADGDTGAAVQTALDAVQMGVAIQKGGGQMAMLVGVAIESLGRQDLWKWREQLSASQAVQSARRLEAIEAKRPSFAAVVTEAKWENLSLLRSIFTKTHWKKFRAGDSKTWAATFKDPADQSRLRTTSDRQIEANLLAAMDASIARANLPYSRALPDVLRPADPLSGLLVSLETSRRRIGSRVSYERNLADNRLLLAAFALQAFATESGGPPQALSELIPKYLQAVPRDPFAPSSPLRYKPNGQNFLLYSVGPDGVDDGAAPIEGRGINRESRGDMVAGVRK